MIDRDSLDEHPLYQQVLASPCDDSPRLALATAIEPAAPQRARYIRMEIELAQEECQAIVAGVDVSLQHEATRTVADGIAEKFCDQWRTADTGLTAASYRGFGEYLRISDSLDPDDVDAAFARFPILHASITTDTELSLRLRLHVDSLVSLWLRGANDQMIARLVEDEHLRNLRRFKVQGPMTMRSIELLCEAQLPALEELEIWSNKIVNPCDIAVSDDWAARNPDEYAIMSRAGAALEQRHGYRKFLHAASRFSVYPCSPAALDILPPLPPERFVRPRQWGDR